jgi:LysM repeat protein
MKTWNRRRRMVSVAVVVAVLASFALLAINGLAVPDQEILVNGSFESGFTSVQGCGAVGNGWGCFNNGGATNFGFYDDQWSSVVADGTHAQLIALSTMGMGGADGDRYAGIYQKVQVVRGATYQLRAKGLMREANVPSGEDPYRYRVQWGFTTNGSTDWSTVNNWSDLSFDRIDDRVSPKGLQSWSTSFSAPADVMTIFFRVWKKFPTTGRELDVDLDAISLFGQPVPYGTRAVNAATCVPVNYVYNGEFESGFAYGVGTGWNAFNNGGDVDYGFQDETWSPVVASGSHSQLMAIGTLNRGASVGDRYAGIFQVINGLTPGATYRFTMSGLMREEVAHPDEDPFRYRVQWGFGIPSSSASQNDIGNWMELPWDQIGLRTAPGAMNQYTTEFTAPSSSVVLGVRAWKKFPTTGRELDVDVDAISVVGCPTRFPIPTPCGYTVQAGDTLASIAAQFGTTVAALAEWNRIYNQWSLVVGQVISVPCTRVAPPSHPEGPCTRDWNPQMNPSCEARQVVPPPGTPCFWYTVVKGDTASGIAARYHSTINLLMQYNSIQDPAKIYVGQELCVVDP